jgi:hypothetical protein
MPHSLPGVVGNYFTKLRIKKKEGLKKFFQSGWKACAPRKLILYNELFKTACQIKKELFKQSIML